MRYELKFIFDNNQLNNFQDWLLQNSSFKKKYENRTVNSVYFDDLYNTSANDNLSGISKREKYRLRWYNNNFVNNLKFEVKKRINRLNFKEFFNFSDSETAKSSSLKYFASLCKNKLNNNNLRYTFDLYPKIQVQYLREYFEDKNSLRITIDKNIKFWRLIEKDNIFNGQSLNYKFNIVEIKFEPEMYSYVCNILRKSNFIPKRHSKYLIGLSLFDELKYI